MNSKYYLRQILIVLLFVGITSNANAQYRQLRIGDTIPDVILPEILKHHREPAHLSDFKGKALLIDFWFTRCTSCIKKFPFLDSIAKVYPDELKILQVTRDSRERVNQFFSESDHWQHLQFPSVVNDSVMNVLFPHRTEPHYVWINKNGIVQAITDGREVHSASIENFVKGKASDLKLKDENMKSDQYFGVYPLMLDYTEIKGDVLSYSYFSKYREGFRAGQSKVYPIYNQKERFYRIWQMCDSFNTLYSIAYNLKSTRNYHPSKIIREDSKKYKFIPVLETRENFFDYDLIVRDTSVAKVFRYMQSDLDKYFDVKSTLEKREIDVLVLKRFDESNAFQSRDIDGYREQYSEGDKYIVRNIPLFNLINVFNTERPIFPYQVLNETGYEDFGLVSIEIYKNLSDMKKVRKSFQRFGLDLVLEKREMEVIVIRD